MKKEKKNSRILREVHEAARDLFDAGVMDATTLRRFDVLCHSRTSRHPGAGAPRKRTSQDNA
jgi:hypothetical protein